MLVRRLLPALAMFACKGPTTVTPPPPPEPAGLVINEVMSGNDSAVRDPASVDCPEFDDWIELVNDSDGPLSLAGVEIADTNNLLVLPDQDLGAGEHLLIWADDQPEQGPLHAPFKVSSGGEVLRLSRGGELLDEVAVPAVARDHSWARVRDGGAEWAEALVSTPGEPNHRVLTDDPCFAPRDGFDDHSYPCLRDEESYLALAGERTELKIVKFDIFNFQSPQRSIVFVDSEFYTLHDQFYLFTVLNGEVFEALPQYPPYTDGEFRTWGQLEAWAREVPLESLVDPLQARFSGDRLYSPYFYSAINGPSRSLGVGTLLHRPATGGAPAFWGFELEYADDISYDDLVVYFEMLAAHGPPELSDVRWLVRSTDQEDLAAWMEETGQPFSDRIVRYSELARPGEVEVYNPGLTAGRVRRIRAGESGLEDALSTDILLLDELPDYLPPCSALITSVPQTPLSHVSLLARSRGIPNLYVAGITEDPEWDAWSRVSTRLALEARGTGEVRAGAMELVDYLRWRALLVANVPELNPVDPTGLPWSYDLISAPEMLALRPLAGGKVAGMRHLLTLPEIDVPDTPLGLSIRGYHAHIDQLDGLEALLAAPPFSVNSALRERFLVLEGRSAYDEHYPDVADAVAADSFLSMHAAGTLLGDLSRGDGIRGWVEHSPMPPEVESALVAAVTAQFSSLPVGEGLRFRSSSTVEDVEGFNGAGLYVSATGYREAIAGQRSIADAVRRVWGSYWGAEAFEERQAAGLEHLDGGMGVLVHPRFDDDFELSNTVLTVSLLPDGSHEMLVNAQDGAVSVANPPTTCPPVLPETVRLSDASGEVVIERLGRSSEVPADEVVLSDLQLGSLFETSTAAVHSWLDAENASIPASWRRSVLTLDLEAREMNAGWLGGTSARLVTKQSRSLEPSVGALPSSIQALPAPRDLLSRAADVQVRVCTDGFLEFTVHSLRTDPLTPPDMGWAEERFLISAQLSALQPVPELLWTTGESRSWSHLDLSLATTDETLTSFELMEGSIEFAVDGGYTVLLEGRERTGQATCTGETLWASPDAFLLDYL